MIECTREARRVCLYACKCRGRHPVDDDSECADFIREVMKHQAAADAVEAEYLRQERQAIQEECTP